MFLRAFSGDKKRKPPCEKIILQERSGGARLQTAQGQGRPRAFDVYPGSAGDSLIRAASGRGLFPARLWSASSRGRRAWGEKGPLWPKPYTHPCSGRFGGEEPVAEADFLPSFGSLRGETPPSCWRSLVAEGLTVRGEHWFLNSPNLSALGSSYRARGTLYAAQLGKPENRRAPCAAKRSRDGQKARQWARTASGVGVSVRLWTEAFSSCIAALRPGRVAILCARPFFLFFFFSSSSEPGSSSNEPGVSFNKPGFFSNEPYPSTNLVLSPTSPALPHAGFPGFSSRLRGGGFPRGLGRVFVRVPRCLSARAFPLRKRARRRTQAA